MPADTSIGLSDETKAALADCKLTDSESFDDVLQRLIENYNGDSDGMDETRVRAIAREEINDAVVFEALE